MNRSALFIIGIIVIIAGVLIFMQRSVQQDAPTPVIEPDSSAPIDGTSEENSTPEDDRKAMVMGKVRTMLVEELGDDVMIDITAIEDKEWPDGCLGLASDDEMCTQVITPGYEVTAEAQGTTYTYRTDLEGTNIRKE